MNGNEHFLKDLKIATSDVSSNNVTGISNILNRDYMPELKLVLVDFQETNTYYLYCNGSRKDVHNLTEASNQTLHDIMNTVNSGGNNLLQLDALLDQLDESNNETIIASVHRCEAATTTLTPTTTTTTIAHEHAGIQRNGQTAHLILRTRANSTVKETLETHPTASAIFVPVPSHFRAHRATI